MDILNILKDVGINLTDQQKKSFKKVFHKYYKSVYELEKVKMKFKDTQRMIDMYSEELNDFKTISSTYKQRYEETYKEIIYVKNMMLLYKAGVLDQYQKFVYGEVLQYINGNTDFKIALDRYISEHPQYIMNKR